MPNGSCKSSTRTSSRHLGLPFLNTDYRALPRWPSYFDVAWRALKPLIGASTYDEAVERVHKKGRGSVNC